MRSCDVAHDPRIPSDGDLSVVASSAPPHPDVCPDCGALVADAPIAPPRRFTPEPDATPLSRRQRISLTAAVVLIVAVITGGVIDSRSSDPDLAVKTEHLQVGDCISQTVIIDEIPTLPEVPCDEPHEREVFASFPPPGPYPGELVAPEGVHEHCEELFLAYAPAYATREFTVAYVLPSEEQWSTPGYVMICMATDFTMRTGSLRDLPEQPPSSLPASTLA